MKYLFTVCALCLGIVVPPVEGLANLSSLANASPALRGRRAVQLHRVDAKSEAPDRHLPLLWVHIHKAAGHYMCHMAKLAQETIVDPEENCNLKGHDSFLDSGHRERSLTCEQRVQLFHNKHFTYGHIERELWPDDLCFGQFVYGILLREPLDLMHSEMNYRTHYYKWHGRVGGKAMLRGLEAELKKNPPPPAGPTVQEPRWKFLDNIQTRLLADAMDVPAGKIDESHLRIAQGRLANFSVVARVEDLKDDARRKTMFVNLGWRAAVVLAPEKKMNKVPVDRHYFTPAESTWLAEVNKHDIALYQSIIPPA